MNNFSGVHELNGRLYALATPHTHAVQRIENQVIPRSILTNEIVNARLVFKIINQLFAEFGGGVSELSPIVQRSAFKTHAAPLPRFFFAIPFANKQNKAGFLTKN